VQFLCAKVVPLTKAILAYTLEYVKEPFVRLFVLLNDCKKNLARFFSFKKCFHASLSLIFTKNVYFKWKLVLCVFY
jgi:hypothetical protein